MGSHQTIEPTWALIKKPKDYPDHPSPDKLQLIWETNSHSLYHRLSPYTDYDMTVINKVFGDKAPYYYIYADENKKGLNALKKYDSRVFPIGSAPIDVIRVAKFLGSGNGIVFLGKQFLLQTGNPFNETRIYNPTSPIVAAGMGLALGSVRPTRHFDTSGGLLGIVRTLIGDPIPNAIFGPPTISKPFGTAPDALLGGPLENTGGKGLIRAGTANRAKAHLEAEWVPVGKQNFSFGSIVKNVVKSLFANFIPALQSGVRQRSDEGAYGLMVGAGGTRFGYKGNSQIFGFTQIWLAGGGDSGNIIRPDGQNVFASRIFNAPDGKTSGISDIKIEGNYITGIGHVGIDIKESPNQLKPGIRYGDSVGESIDKEFQASTVMLDYSRYIQPINEFQTKDPDKRKEELNKIQNSLSKVLENIKNASDNLYTVDIEKMTTNDSTTVRSGKAESYGYDRLFDAKQKMTSPVSYKLGMLHDYKETRLIDDTLGSNKPSMRFSTAGKFDAINTLTVLSKDTATNKWKEKNLKGWENRDWVAYKDDQIAFFFYDVVNEKYIPFRASIKTLSENSNASWEELPFIGRGDKVYSYGGFNRNLSLSINVVISSLAELAPVWQKVNYLTTLTKPANYTTSDYQGVMNRFMIPPMVMLTLGDLYRDQPVPIQTITTNIPDDASWETQNEDNSPDKWEYLATYMNSSKVLYAQLPRVIDITLALILLEKERAIVGGANFGHAPRRDDLLYWNTDTIPDKKRPNKFHESLVVTKGGEKILSYEETQAQYE